MDPSALVGIRWVHVFEEDGPEGHVYRPESGPIPLSRRPREAFTLNAGGGARVESGGPDDRPVSRPARWHHSEEGVVVESADGTPIGTIRSADPERLVLQRPAD